MKSTFKLQHYHPAAFSKHHAVHVEESMLLSKEQSNYLVHLRTRGDPETPGRLLKFLRQTALIWSMMKVGAALKAQFALFHCLHYPLSI
jgi:hypothetical protein